MRVLLFAFAACALGGCASLSATGQNAPAPQVATAPQVTIAQGTLQGAALGDIEAFRDIPYAAPPVGGLRWRPPQPAPSWQGVREADRFGPACVQNAVSWADDNPPGATSEDCLTLNILRPKGAQKRPVLVWIHGGGYLNGSAAAPIYDGSSFARDGLVFVSLDYRLGRFGFFAFPALTAEHPDEPKGNYAFMDQIAALRWIKANIAAFGGDPDRITIMGESAGGGSVLALLCATDARGLFQGAIVESGGGREVFGRTAPRLAAPAGGTPSAEQDGVAFAQSLGIDGTGTEALAALRALPAAKIAGSLNMATSDDSNNKTTYPGPMIDGQIVGAGPAETFARGNEIKVPILVGANSGDISTFKPKTKQEAFASFGPAAAAARAAYDPDGTMPLDKLAYEIGMDRMMIEPARLVARTYAAAGEPAYEYRYDYIPPARAADSPDGAQHFSEVPFVFETQRLFKGGQTAPGDGAIAAQMHAYWVNFAETGDPNGPGLPVWPRYSVTGDGLLAVTQHGPVGMADPWKARLDALTASYPVRARR